MQPVLALVLTSNLVLVALILQIKWQLLVLGIACLLLPGEGSVYLFIYSCLLNDKFVIPCLFHVIRTISMVGCRITFGLRPHVIRHPTIDIFPYYVNKQGITNTITRLMMICMTDFDTQACQTHHAQCASGVFTVSAHSGYS